MRRQKFDSTSISIANDAINLIVDRLGCCLAIIRWGARIASTQEWTGTFAKGDGAESFAHTPTHHHLAGKGRDPLQVVLGTRGNASNRHLLSGPSTQCGD